MKNNDFILHLISWVVTVSAAIIPLLKNNYTLFFLFISLAFLISLLLLIRKNRKLKKEINTYESLLKNSTPLYGIINYIFRKKTSSKENINKEIHLDIISLNVELCGNILEGKNNDLKFDWTFKGKNASTNDIDVFFVRIGGDSASTLNALQVKCIDCLSNDKNCKDCASTPCVFDDNCWKDYKAAYDAIDDLNSQTLYLLKIKFNKKTQEYGDIKLKLSYIWPQCFNCNHDFILIDPSNFAKKVKEIKITIKIDNKVIKENSNVQLYSVNKNNNKIINEGKVNAVNNKTFEGVFAVDQKNLYFVEIKNT